MSNDDNTKDDAQESAPSTHHQDDTPLAQAASSQVGGEVDAEGETTANVDDSGSRGKGRRISISLRSIIFGAISLGLVAALGVMTWLYLDAKAQVDADAKQAADHRRAEQVALGYAVDAAIMDFKNLGPWKQNLVKGTTPELSAKLSEAANAMEQIVLPLEWTSTAKPLAAKVRSDTNGIYVVDAFVSVMTKTVQAADSLQSTATYSITIDSNNNWLISDVGGIAAVVGNK